MSTKIPTVAIVGRPNVGKSSLFNRLVGRRKAIVSETPGTTRDRVEATVEWGGTNFWLVDTAGFETATDELETSMQYQLDIARNNADVIMIVIDGSTILSDTDGHVIKQAYRSGKPIIAVANKADRKHPQVEFEKLPTGRVIAVSAAQGTGCNELLDELVAILPKHTETIHKLPTLAILGRPNVGKSSLLNALSRQNRAIVADFGGTTRDTNEIVVKAHGKKWRLIDTAGLRRVGRREDSIEYYSAMRTAQAIEESDVCMLVCDATEPATTQDQRIAGMVKEAGKGLFMVINKWDLVERNDDNVKRLHAIFNREFQFAWWAPMIMTSATDEHNLHKIIETAESIYINTKRKVPTKELNRLLQTAVAMHPPAGLKNRHPKLNYVTQVDIKPPTFCVFGTQTPFLHWSYKRYLEGKLRDQYDFSGTPVRFQWRSKYKDRDEE